MYTSLVYPFTFKHAVLKKMRDRYGFSQLQGEDDPSNSMFYDPPTLNSSLFEFGFANVAAGDQSREAKAGDAALSADTYGHAGGPRAAAEPTLSTDGAAVGHGKEPPIANYVGMSVIPAVLGIPYGPYVEFTSNFYEDVTGREWLELAPVPATKESDSLRKFSVTGAAFRVGGLDKYGPNDLSCVVQVDPSAEKIQLKELRLEDPAKDKGLVLVVGVDRGGVVRLGCWYPAGNEGYYDLGARSVKMDLTYLKMLRPIAK
jgi:hypothetical protein